MTNRMQWRQGDVLMERVDAVPAEAVPRPGETLFQGERSGHAHAIRPADGVDILAHADTLYLRATGPFTVVHDEHGPITLEPGLYRVWRQREYDPRRFDARGWSDVDD
jgi:hypothetical protein